MARAVRDLSPYLLALSPKCARAHQLIDELRKTLREYHSTEPVEVCLQAEPSDPRDELVRAWMREEIPPEIPLLFGDFVHNLRSALDHALWERTDESQRGRGTSFPILIDEADFEKENERMLRGVPSNIVEVIERQQPYHDETPDVHPLRVVHELDRVDKHRTIPVCVAALRAMTLKGDTSGYRFEGLTARVSQDWAPIGRIRLRPDDEKLIPYWDVTLDDGGVGGAQVPPDRRLSDVARKLYDAVRSVLEQIEQSAQSHRVAP